MSLPILDLSRAATKMATERMVTLSTEDGQIQCSDVKISVNCVNCTAMKEQLFAALQDLKSAKTIISLLQEDLKHNSHVPTIDAVMPVTSEMTNGLNLMCEKWTAVSYNSKKVNQSHTENRVTMKHTSTTASRFAPLATVNETGHIRECEPQLSQPPKKPISHRYQASKIPTIVNGIVNMDTEEKPSKIRSNISPKLRRHSSKPGHKVNIIGDSHLKGADFRLNQYLNTGFEICSLIKPGATIKQVVHSQESELERLGKKDFLVIAGGTNDIDKPNSTISEVIVPLIHFIQKHNNINVIIVNIPHRYDLENVSNPININSNIHRCNVTLRIF